jgi:hypothetical protein
MLALARGRGSLKMIHNETAKNRFMPAYPAMA